MADTVATPAAPVKIPTHDLSRDVFEAERRGRAQGDTFRMPGTPALSAEQVIEDYTAQYAGISDTPEQNRAAFDSILARQGFRLNELVTFAKEDPYNYKAYTDVEDYRRSAGYEVPTEGFDEAKLDLEVQPMRQLGTEGALYDDAPEHVIEGQLAHPVDPNYAGIDSVADSIFASMTEAEQAEIASWENGTEINMAWVQGRAERALAKRQVEFGTERYAEELRKEQRRQLRSLMVLRTAGYWNGFVRTPEGLFDDTKSPESWLEGMDVATQPTRKIVGYDRNNQLVYQQESKSKYTLDMLDIPRMLALGAYEHGFADSWRGVADRASATRGGYYAGKKTGIPGAKYVLGTAALGVDMFSPDMLSVATAGSKAVTGIAKGSKLFRGNKLKVAKELRKAESLIKQGVDTQSPELIRQGVEVITQVKLDNPAIRGHLNRVTEDIGAKFGEQAKAALKDTTKLSPEEIEYHRQVLVTAGDLQKTDNVKVFERVLGPENFDFGGKRVELRTGVRKTQSQTRKAKLTSAQMRQGEDSVFNFAKVLDDLDKAEVAIESAGTFVPDVAYVSSKVKKTLRQARNEVMDQARDLGKRYDVNSGTMKRALKAIEAAAKKSEDTIQEIIKKSGAGIKGATQKDIDQLVSRIDNELSKAIDEFAGQGLTAVIEHAAARSRTAKKSYIADTKVQSLKIPDIDKEIADLRKRMQRAADAPVPEEVSSLKDKDAPFTFGSYEEAAATLLGKTPKRSEDLFEASDLLKRQVFDKLGQVLRVSQDPVEAFRQIVEKRGVEALRQELNKVQMGQRAKKLLDTIEAGKELSPDDIEMFELAADVWYSGQRRELLELKQESFELLTRARFQQRLEAVFEEGAIDFSLFDEKLRYTDKAKRDIVELQKEVRRQARIAAKLESDLGFIARESEAVAREVLRYLEPGKGKDVISRAKKVLKLDLEKNPEFKAQLLESLGGLAGRKTGYYVQAAKRWAGAALRRIEFEQAMKADDVKPEVLESLKTKILAEREKESKELVKFFKAAQELHTPDPDLPKELERLKDVAASRQRRARELRNLTRDVAKHNRKIERQQKALRKSYEASAKRLLRKMEVKQRIMEAVQKRLDQTPDVLSKAAFFGRLGEIGADFIGSALDDIVEQVYTKNPVQRAKEQIEVMRAATYLNAKYLSEGAGRVAAQLEKNLILSTESSASDVATKEGFDFGATLLDPGSVDSPVEMLSRMFNIPASSIKRRILEGDPIVVDFYGSQVTLDAELLSSATIKGQTKAYVETVTKPRSIEVTEGATGIAEATPTESLDSLILRWADTSDTAPATFISNLYKFVFGGPIDSDIRDIAPVMRDVVKRIPRVVNQTVSDLVRLMQDNDLEGMYKFLAGVDGKFQSGRHIISSGNISVPESITLTIEKMLRGVAADTRYGVERASNIRKLLAQPINESGLIADLESIQKTEWGAQAIDDLVSMLGRGIDDAASGLTEADKATELKTPHVINDVLSYVQSDYKQNRKVQIEALSFFSVAYNAGRNVTNEAEAIEAARLLAQGAYKAFGGAANHEKAVTAMNRALPIFTAHTAAAVELRRIGDLNISVTETDFKHWNNYLEGRPVPREWRQGKGATLSKLYGEKTKFGEFDVMGDTMYLPSPVVRSFDSAIANSKDVAADLIKDPDSYDAGKMWISNLTTTILKTRVIGAFMLRSRYPIAAIYEGLDNAATGRSIAVGTTHALRMFSQIPMSVPGVIQGPTALRKMGELTEYLSTKAYGELDEVPERIREMARVLKNANATTIQEYLGKLGDDAAEKLGAFLGHGKWSVDTNKIMRGADDAVEIPGGSLVTYRDLRQFLVAEGIISDSYQKSYLRTTLYRNTSKLAREGGVSYNKLAELAKDVRRVVVDEFGDWHKAVSDYAEQLGERERISMFIAYLNEGLTLPEAARLTRKTLHDYQGNMSAFDMNMFVRLFIPYFTYRKNNNRLMLDLMLDPRTAYRMSVKRNFVKGAIVLAQETLNDAQQDELGVQVHLIQDPEVKRNYIRLRAQLMELNEGKAFTQEQRAVLRGYLFGQDRLIEGGRQYLIPKQHDILKNISELIGVSSATAPSFNTAFLPQYMQSRDVLVLPQLMASPKFKEDREYLKPVVWNYVALPESGQVAFVEHAYTLLNTMTYMAQAFGAPVFYEDYALTEEAYRHLSTQAAKELLQPEFSPLTHMVFSLVGASDETGQYKIRISERAFTTLEAHFPSMVTSSGGKVVDGVVVEEPRYYASPLIGEFLGLVVPLASAGVTEASKTAQDLRQPKVDTGEPIYDFSMNFLRFMGVQIERTDAERARVIAQPRFSKTTTTPPE